MMFRERLARRRKRIAGAHSGRNAMRGIAILATGILLTGCVSSPGTSGNNQPPPTYPFPAANTLQFVHEFGTNTTTADMTVPGDAITGLQTDGSGNLLLAGYTRGNLPGYSAPAEITKGTLYKFDASGNQIWAKELTTGAGDGLNGIAVTASGIFVVGDTAGTYPGASNPNGIDEAFVAKYDTSGNQLWLKQYSSSRGVMPVTLCADSSGDLIFAGVISNSAGGTNLFVQKVDSSGNTVWQETYGNEASDLMGSVAVDASGNIYLAGLTVGAFPGLPIASVTTSTNIMPFILKLDGGTGSTVWLEQFTGDSSLATFYPASVQIAPGEKLDVLGQTGSATNAQGIVVMQLDAATGSMLWQVPFGNGEFSDAGQLAVDSSGNIYAAGTTTSALASGVTSTQDVFLAKIGPGGQEIWAQQFGTGLDESSFSIDDYSAPVYLSLGNQIAFVGGMTLGQFQGFSNPNRNVNLFLAKFGQ